MFDKVRKNFGYCCMRLPMQGKEVDYAEFNKMIDAFLDNGFNYFVPAHGYLDGHTICLCRGGERLWKKPSRQSTTPTKPMRLYLKK